MTQRIYEANETPEEQLESLIAEVVEELLEQDETGTEQAPQQTTPPTGESEEEKKKGGDLSLGDEGEQAKKMVVALSEMIANNGTEETIKKLTDTISKLSEKIK